MLSFYRAMMRVNPPWKLISWLCCLVAAGCQSTHAFDTAQKIPADCKPFKRSDGLLAVAVGLNGTGKFCLIEDLVQRRVYDFVEGRKNVTSPGKDGIIEVFENAHDLDIDLQGHLVTGAPFDDTTGIKSSNQPRVRVHNGTIKTPGPEGVGVAMAVYKEPSRFQWMRYEDVAPMKYIRYRSAKDDYDFADPWNYLPETNYILENLKISSGGRGVILGGTGNILRNNVIEVDSATAAYIYGPKAVIEGNTFIVHKTKGEPAATLAILKLRDAHGAIIRNNRFIVKGWGVGQTPAAINLLESSDVTIENNQIEGAQSLVRKDASTTTVERANTLK